MTMIQRVRCPLKVRGMLAMLTCLASSAWLTAGAEEPSQKAPAAVIQLKGGDFAAGQLVDSPDGDSLSWKSAAFADRLRFPLPAVQGIHFPIPDKLPQPEGDYCFELAGGDLLFGSLVSLEGDAAVLDIPAFGRLHVERAIMRRMVRWNKAELIFFGPSGLDGWQTSGIVEPGIVKPWRENAGHLIADQDGATLRRDFHAPPLARFEIELSWSMKPDFELAFGVGLDPKTALRAFHFEVWENQLVAVRETEREADVAALLEIKPGAGRVSLQVFLDLQRGRMLVFSSSGQQLGDLTVATGKPQSFGGVQIINKHGDLKLESLRIGRWNGEPPRILEADKSRILGTDGTITYGQLKRYDAGQHQFVVEVAAAELRVDEDRIQDVFLAKAGEVAPRSLRAVLFSGLRTSGDLVKVEQNTVWLKCPGIQEPLSSPISALQSLTVLQQSVDVHELKGRAGRLELEGTMLHGCLVDGREADASCLVWQPLQSTTASPLTRGVSARIIYRDPPPPPKPQQAPPARVVAGGGLAALARLIQTPNAGGPSQSTSKQKQTTPVLHLRSGDTIPCMVTGIDEKGITFETALTDAKFVRHDQVKALELMPEAAPAKIAKPKKERLLTLPRMQRDNPPTQLIRSVDGDYLRGRLVEMDDKQLQVEVRLETKTLPRDSVARIIWLHADEIESAAPPAATPGEPTGSRVQAIPNAGNRLTFVAERVEGATLSGRSELLGICRVDLGKIDQLLVGAAIEQAAATLAFHQWRLKPAADPLAAKDTPDGAEDGAEGLESALVGKPAPNFELDLLDGKKFRLADRKDKILVLDFWASWCSPCLQVMPQVDKVVHEFADQNVELLAINLEETPDRVQTALERLQLTMAVALDRDGLVAEKYGATSIPQTVIIGRDGKVARLFVGGSARFDEQLRGALKSLLTDRAEKID